MAAFPIVADTTPQQEREIADCGTMSKAVQLFAEARDQGLSKPDAFQAVTRGETPDLPGSPVDQTEQWAYDHPDERPDAVSVHFYSRCRLDVLGFLSPAAEKELTAAAAACQHDHDKPDEVRTCINAKADAMIAAGGAKGDNIPSGVAAELPASLDGIGKVTIGMPIADAKKVFPNYGERGRDEHGDPEFTFMISHDHGFVVLLTQPGKPDTVIGVEIHGGADVDMDPILGLRLGENAGRILTQVGQPSRRDAMPDGDDSLWSYAGRNYSFVVSSGGDLIAIRVYGDTGLRATAAAASTSPAPAPATYPSPR